MSSTFYNSIVTKPRNDKDYKYIRIGSKRFDNYNEFYGSNMINTPFAHKADLVKNDHRARFKYVEDYQIFRKHPELVNPHDYKVMFIDIENTNGIYKGGYPPVMHKITVCTLRVDSEVVQVRLDEDFGNNEIHLLDYLLKCISQENVIITGWHVAYDVELILERWRCITGTEPPNILNPIIDLQALYRFYYKDKENSFRLDNILKLHDIEAKIRFDGSFDKLYAENRSLYYEYNRRDVDGIFNLDKKLGLFALAKTTKEISGCLWQDIIHNSKIIESILYRFLEDRGMVFWNNPRTSFEKYKGGFVYEPKPGVYPELYCFDFASLYPNTIITWNIGPDTLIKNLSSTEATPVIHGGAYNTAPKGVYFATHKRSIIAELAISLLEKRSKLKAECKANNLPKSDPTYVRQNAYKTIANSVYGIFGRPHLRFACREIAESITLCSQGLITFVGAELDKRSVHAYGKPMVVYGDTDSLYLDTSFLKEHTGDPEMTGYPITKSGYLDVCIHKNIIPMYNREHGFKESTYSMEDEYGAVEGIIVEQKKHYIIRKPGEKVDITGFIKTDKGVKANELFKPLCEAILNGHITTWEHVEKYKEWIKSQMKLTDEWLKPYRQNMPLEEYKTKQRWISGLENLKKYYTFNGDFSRGIILEMLRKPDGPRAVKPVEVPVTIPEDLFTFIPSLVKIMAEQGLWLNEENQHNAVCTNIDMLTSVFKGEK